MSAKFVPKKRKIAIAAIIVGCIVAIVAIVTTSVLLAGRSAPVVDAPVIDKPVIDNPVVDPPDDHTDPDTPTPPAVQLSGMPVDGTVIKGYDANKLVYSSTLDEWNAHTAVDLKAEKGTPVKAILDGVVEKTGSDALFGSYVVIRHSDDRVSIYKSLENDLSVKVGDTVAKGAVIGKVGDTMSNEKKDGPHLHFEMKVKDKFVNPADHIADLGNK